MIAKRSVPLPLVITTVNIESSTGTLFISLTSFHSLALTIISTRHVHRQKSSEIKFNNLITGVAYVFKYDMGIPDNLLS